MTAIQIRDVPEAARDALAERARQRGQSLSAFLRDVVLREAGFVRNGALVDEIDVGSDDADYGVDDVLNALDNGRAGRRS